MFKFAFLTTLFSLQFNIVLCRCTFPRVLILDVDGTLYDDNCLIEEQIREGCHLFARKFGYGSEECEKLHIEYGSTISGIIKRGSPKETIADYYNVVYPRVRMDKLQKYSRNYLDFTGYQFEPTSLKDLYKIQDIVVIASNSPLFHVMRVINRLGLSRLNTYAFMTPDRLEGKTKSEPSFWDPLLTLFPVDQYNLTLIDDNLLNIQVAEAAGMRGIRINSTTSLKEALLLHVGIIDQKIHSDEEFRFNTLSYLHAKNQVDLQSLSSKILARLAIEIKSLRANRRKVCTVESPSSPSSLPPLELEDRRPLPKQSILRVCDLGAGKLSMLPPLLELARNLLEEENITENLFSEEKERKVTSAIQYVAFESNLLSGDLLPPCDRLLQGLGLSRLKEEDGQEEAAAEGEGGGEGKGKGHTKESREYWTYRGDWEGLDVTVHLVPTDFMSVKAAAFLDQIFGPGQSRQIDVVVGSSLVDLVPPSLLAYSLVELCADAGAVLYFPVTFAGSTRIVRRKGEGEGEGGDLAAAADGGGGSNSAGDLIDKEEEEDDDRVLGRYHQHLQSLGWFQSLRDNGDRSDWLVGNQDLLFTVDPILMEVPPADITAGPWTAERFAEESKRLFAQRGGVGQLEEEGTETETESGHGDTDSSRDNAASDGSTTACSNEAATLYESGGRFVEFCAPGLVHVVPAAVTPPAAGKLLLRTICSVISPGTELKVFRGDFESGQPTDLTIGGMSDEMKYPLRYGYSLVGEVVAVGEGVDPGLWMHKRVFAFCPHGSVAEADLSSVILTPDDIDPEDAVFAPSVETAVSFVQDARPVLGDRVAVIGQGLIGLLTGAVLSCMGLDVTAVDVNSKRLLDCKLFNTDAKLWNPLTDSKTEKKDFDICIEVSGSTAGLQTAIDATGYGGKVVVGSWYGTRSSSPLSLGSLRTHRSHLKIHFSQVSAISADLTDRWDKKRRFELTWEVLKKLRPSRLLRGSQYRRSLSSTDITRAYQDLEKGDILTCLLDPALPIIEDLEHD